MPELPELPELPAAGHRSAELAIVSSPAGADDVLGGAGPEGRFIFERLTDSVCMRYPGMAEFVLSGDMRQIEVRSYPGVPDSTVRHLLIDLVIPSALGSLGELVLHASGVGVGNGAVLFLGPSGAGKSTMAGGLERRGWRSLCDDGARLVADGSKFGLVPSYPGLRLWPDGAAFLVDERQNLTPVAHNTPKVRWVPGGPPLTQMPLVCVFVLDDSPEAVEVGPLSPRQAMYEVFHAAFRLPGVSREALQRQFDSIGELVTTCPFYRLAYPYDFAKLDEAMDLVEATAAAQGG